MTKALILSCCRRTGLSVLAGLALSLQLSTAAPASYMRRKTKRWWSRASPCLPLEQRAQVTYDAYILGPGDRIQIELLDLPELGGEFIIGPDGTIHLLLYRPFCKGLTIEELKLFLREQFRSISPTRSLHHTDRLSTCSRLCRWRSSKTWLLHNPWI